MSRGEGETLDETLARLSRKPKGEPRASPAEKKKTVWGNPVFYSGRKRRTHCLKGHELTPENTIVMKSGSRYCRTCAEIRRIRDKRNSRKKKYTIRPGTENLPRNPSGSVVNPKALPPRPGGGSDYPWNYDIGNKPATWDDPYAQIEDVSEEIVWLAKRGRLGARIIGHEGGDDPAREAMMRLDAAIAHARKKGFDRNLAIPLLDERKRQTWLENLEAEEVRKDELNRLRSEKTKTLRSKSRMSLERRIEALEEKLMRAKRELERREK